MLQTDPELNDSSHVEKKAVPEPRISAPSSESFLSGGGSAKQEDNVCMTRGSLVTIINSLNSNRTSIYWPRPSFHLEI